MHHPRRDGESCQETQLIPPSFHLLLASPTHPPHPNGVSKSTLGSSFSEYSFLKMILQVQLFGTWSWRCLRQLYPVSVLALSWLHCQFQLLAMACLGASTRWLESLSPCHSRASLQLCHLHPAMAWPYPNDHLEVSQQKGSLSLSLLQNSFKNCSYRKCFSK